jgi:uncharacterized protein YlaI
MKKENELTAFKCLECGDFLDIGLCGDHRIETSHKTFEPVYKKVIKKEEIHLCRICGQSMPSGLCIPHRKLTGHSDFKPIFEVQQLKGGIQNDP